MKNINNYLIIIACFLFLNNFGFAQDGLILPMPGQKTTSQPATNTKTDYYNQTPKTNNNSRNQNQGSYKHYSQDSSGTILPLPNPNKKYPVNTQKEKRNDIEKENPLTPKDPKNQPLIAIPSPISNNSNNQSNITKPNPLLATPSKNNSNANKEDSSSDSDNFFNDEEFSNFFKNDDDFMNSNSEQASSNNESNVENILPSTESETTIAQDSSGGSIKVYPKDTGAAIFMVMKSWKCDDYDGVSLINQALEVYGKEAGEEFKINGLENLTKGFCISIEEEDITFDEMLDIFASKSGNDWGCDIPNKTIYFYPKGIKTESYVSWE